MEYINVVLELEETFTDEGTTFSWFLLYFVQGTHFLPTGATSPFIPPAVWVNNKFSRAVMILVASEALQISMKTGQAVGGKHIILVNVGFKFLAADGASQIKNGFGIRQLWFLHVL